MSAKILLLARTQPGPSDETKLTGIVAEAAVFSDGSAVLHWLTKPGATEVYASEKDMRKIREFSGRSRFFEPEPEARPHLYDNLAEALERGDEVTIVDMKDSAQLGPWAHLQLSDDDSEAQAAAAEQRAQFPPADLPRRRPGMFIHPFETGEPFRSGAERDWDDSR
jgi:hypothetical protein